MKKKLLSTALAAFVVLSMTACGGSSEAPAQTPAAETESASEAGDAAAESESANENAAENENAAGGGSFIIATDTVFAPFEFTDADNNFVGIDVDILAASPRIRAFPMSCSPLALTPLCWLWNPARLTV